MAPRSDVRVIDGSLTLRASRSSSISGGGTISARDGFVRTMRVLGATVALARVVIDGPQSVIGGSLVAEDVEFRVGPESAGWVFERTRAELRRVSVRGGLFAGPQLLRVGEGAELIAQDLAFRVTPELGLAEDPWGRGVLVAAGGRAAIQRMLVVGVGTYAVSIEAEGVAMLEDATLLGTGNSSLESRGTLTAERVRVGGSENQALYAGGGRVTLRDLFVTWNHARAIVASGSAIVEAERVRVLGSGDGALSVDVFAVLRARSVETRLTSQSRCAGSCNDTLAAAGEGRLEVERFMTHRAARGLRLENDARATLRDGQLECEDAFVIGASNASDVEAPELWLQNVAVSAAQELFRIVPD